jgi:hypothetical protein
MSQCRDGSLHGGYPMLHSRTSSSDNMQGAPPDAVQRLDLLKSPHPSLAASTTSGPAFYRPEGRLVFGNPLTLPSYRLILFNRAQSLISQTCESCCHPRRYVAGTESNGGPAKPRHSGRRWYRRVVGDASAPSRRVGRVCPRALALQERDWRSHHGPPQCDHGPGPMGIRCRGWL